MYGMGINKKIPSGWRNMIENGVIFQNTDKRKITIFKFDPRMATITGAKNKDLIENYVNSFTLSEEEILDLERMFIDN